MIAMALMALPAAAEIQHEADCKKWSEMAHSVMTARQSGTPAVDAMEHYLGQAGADDRQNYKDLIVSAYSQSRWATEAVRNAAIVDFADEVWAICMNSGPFTDRPGLP